MGKKKIDKLKLIDSKLQRNVAFCKRKRGFLKKAIELSCLCDQKIFIIIYDEERKRTVQFSSDENFEIKHAYESIKISKEPLNIQNYEKFTNDDYQRLEQVDFRSVRYKKKHLFGDDMEVISDLESNLDGESPESDDTKQQASKNQTSSKQLEMPDDQITQRIDNTILVPQFDEQLPMQKPKTMVEDQQSHIQVNQNLDDVSSNKKFGSEHGREPKERPLKLTEDPEQVKENKIANSKRVQKEMEKQMFKAMNLVDKIDQHKIPKIPSVNEIPVGAPQQHPEASPNTADQNQPQIPNSESIKAGTPLNLVLQEFMKQNQFNNIQKILDTVQNQQDPHTTKQVENIQLDQVEGTDVQITEQNEKNQRHILDLLIQAKQLQQKQQNLEKKPDHESQKNVQTIINTAQQLFMNNGLNIQQQLNQQNQHIENLSQNLLNLVQYHQQVQATQPKIEQQFQRVVNNRDPGVEHQQQQQQNILNNTSYFNFNNINMQNAETPMFQTQEVKQLRHPQQVNVHGWNMNPPQQQPQQHHQQQNHNFMHQQQPLQNLSPMLKGQSIFNTNHNNAPVPNIHEHNEFQHPRQNHQMTQQQVLGQNQMILGNQQVVSGEKVTAKKRLSPLRQKEQINTEVSVAGISPQIIGMDILGDRDFINDRSQQSNEQKVPFMYQGGQNRMQKHLRQKVKGQGVEASDIDSLNDFFKDHHSNK